MNIFPTAFLIVIFLAPPLLAQDAAEEAATVLDVSGRRHTGSLRELAGSTLVIGRNEPKRFDAADLLSVRFNGRAAKTTRQGSVVVLANGDRLFVRPQSMDEAYMAAAWQRFPAWPDVKMRLERIRAVAFNLPEDDAARHRLTTTLLDYREKSDAVILKNGDRLQGELATLSRDSLSFQGPVGRLTVALADVRAVTFNSELVSFPDETGLRVLLELTDGTRLTARRLELTEPGLLTVDALFGARLAVPLSAVVSLRFLGGRAEYLSDLEAAEYRFTPFLGTRWPLRRDRNVLGGPLRIAGREYAKGIGLHSRSRVTYDLQGGYRQFRATIGVDDSAGKRGSVVFAVEVDGERRFTSDPLTGKSEALSIPPIDVSGKDRLTLIVDFGQFGDIRDHADWCDAVLIR